MNLGTICANVIVATKESSVWLYRTSYCGNAGVTISHREPTTHQILLTSIHSFDYARVTGISVSASRRHLRKVVDTGLLIEQPTRSGIVTFRLRSAEAVQIGKEIIADLRAQGLPFDDEWRAARNKEGGAA